MQIFFIINTRFLQSSEALQKILDFGPAPNPFLVYRFKLENHDDLLFYTMMGEVEICLR